MATGELEVTVPVLRDPPEQATLDIFAGQTSSRSSSPVIPTPKPKSTTDPSHTSRMPLNESQSSAGLDAEHKAATTPQAPSSGEACQDSSQPPLDSPAMSPSTPLLSYEQSDAEHIKNQFSSTAMVGIRSLPDALAPHFRERLFAELLAIGKLRHERQQQQMRQHAGASGKADHHAAALAPLLAHGAKAGPLQVPVAAGQTAPQERSALRHMFTVFEHGHSDLAAFVDAMTAHRREQRRLCIGPQFTATAMPRPPAGITAFSGFTYTEDPFESADEARLRQQAQQMRSRLAARYVPGGRPQPHSLNKSSLDTCLLQLHATLARDWPASFVQVFEDIPGCIVLSFHRALAALEGDVTAYMNQHYRTDDTVAAFRLVKDTGQWGATVDGVAQLNWGVFFVYWPPWAARPKVVPPHLAGPRPAAAATDKWQGPLAAPLSVRDPFGARTANGLLAKYDTRVHERSMRMHGPTTLQ
eukprot:jgi/Ulvmu1/11851/UM081_0009.1